MLPIVFCHCCSPSLRNVVKNKNLKTREGHLATGACTIFLTTLKRRPRVQTGCYHIRETKEEKLYERLHPAALRAQVFGCEPSKPEPAQ